METVSHPGPVETNGDSDGYLFATLIANATDFLQPPPALATAALLHSKRILDPLASLISDAQERRVKLEQASSLGKRKRKSYNTSSASVLRLKQIHLPGFNADQVWEQARRVLEAGQKELDGWVNELVQENKAIRVANEQEDLDHPESLSDDDLEDDDDGNGMDGLSDDAEDIDGLEDGSLDEDDEGEEAFGDELHDDYDEMAEDDEAEDREGDEDLDDQDEEEAEVLVKDKHGLNDGFFSIDEFNRQTEFMEQQDMRGEPDAEDEEDEIDWDSNPLAMGGASGPTFKSSSGNKKRQNSDDEDDGPTFGNADLNAPFSDSDDDGMDDEDEDMGDGMLENTNEIQYDDFFVPPARAPSKKPKKPRSELRPLPKPSEEDVQRTIDAVRRDLFDDDFDEEQDLSDDEDPNDPSTVQIPKDANMSTHERQGAALAKQIAVLEQANVSKRAWTMQGETSANARPLNSLLEEDLDFERTGKPVPVITAEVSEDIEALIKRRILAKEFDEVIKRRPGVEMLSSSRKPLGELDNTKDRRGLADIYAEEHSKTNDPNYVSNEDKATLAAQESITKLWNEVSAKLDSLVSMTTKVKPVEMKINVIKDTPRILLEEARPGGIEGTAPGTETLAPQDIYDPASQKKKLKAEGMVVTKGGTVLGDGELSKEAKKRRRMREKERVRKREGQGQVRKMVLGQDGRVREKEPVKEKQGKAADQQRVLKDLKAGGVKVIGKGGELKDVEGKEVREKASRGSGAFKL